MGNRIGRAVDRIIWGRTAVQCEECGTEVASSDAIWRGRKAYCSIEHEAADAAEAAYAAPRDVEVDEPARVLH